MRRTWFGKALSFESSFLLMLTLSLVLSSACGSDAAVSDPEDSEADEDDSEDEEDGDEEADEDDSEDEEDDAGATDRKDAGKLDASSPGAATGKPAAGSGSGATIPSLPTADAGTLPARPGLPGFGAPAAPVTPLDPSVRVPDPSKLPKPKGACPDLKSGRFSIAGTTGTMWVGSKPGPLLFYWHGTGSSASEVDTGIPGATAEVSRSGGIVASFETTSSTGENTGNLVWFTGDFDAADQILACGVEKNLVDTARIYSSGYSAGGLQTGAMVFSRSNYLASAIVYSGGPALGGLAPGSTTFVDPSNVPAVIGAHGAQGSDWLALDFSDGTKKLDSAVAAAGGFAVGCDDGGSHLDFFTIRAGIGGKAWQFLKDHPYNTKPSPYASALPAGFPRYCKIVGK